MKKLLYILLICSFILQIKATTHWCQCKDYSLAPIDCHNACSSEGGWSGHATYTSLGIVCNCKSGRAAEIKCSDWESKSWIPVPKNCAIAGGFTGNVYNVETGKFH